MKVRFGMTLGETTEFVESLQRRNGSDAVVPNFGTLPRRQKSLKVNIAYRGSDALQHQPIDSTGIEDEGEG